MMRIRLRDDIHINVLADRPLRCVAQHARLNLFYGRLGFRFCRLYAVAPTTGYRLWVYTRTNSRYFDVHVDRRLLPSPASEKPSEWMIEFVSYLAFGAALILSAVWCAVFRPELIH